MTWLYVLGGITSLGLLIYLVIASGSGLDPHISPAAAAYQIPRVARLRGVAPATLDRLVAGYTEGKQWGFLSEQCPAPEPRAECAQDGEALEPFWSGTGDSIGHGWISLLANAPANSV